LEQSRTQVVVYVLAAVLLVVAAVKLLGPGGDGPRASPPVRVDEGGAQGGEKGRVYVHVAGAVRRPGLYRVRRSARVAAAVARAGGPTRRGDLTAVNLAAPLEDGQQVVVPRAGAAPTAAPTGHGAAASAGGTGGVGAAISLATATVEQLDGLDGIGPTLAKRIVEYRDSHGGIRSVDELKEVDGIGEKRFAALRGAVRP
jgi:competence protein ComEA